MIDFWSQGGAILAAIVVVSLLAWWRLFAGWQIVLYHRKLREKSYQKAKAIDGTSWYDQATSLENMIYEQAKLLSGGAHKRLKQRLHTMLDARAEKLFRPGRYVAVMAGVCPLLGLLGTVFGMLDVFVAINQSGFSEVGRMAGGINQALLTTQAGLVMALPLVVGHSWLKWIAERDQRLMMLQCYAIQDHVEVEHV